MTHSIDVHWTVPGTYDICVRLNQISVVATDSEPKCDIPYDVYCKTVRVLPEYIVTPASGEICETDNFTFCTAPTPAGGINWTATTADGSFTQALGSGACINVSGLPAGFYEIIANSNDPNFCNDEASGFLTVQGAAPMLAPTALTGETNICPGSSYDYSATPDNGYYLQWSATNGTVLGTGTDVAITWGASGPYSVEITQVPMTGPACPSTTSFPISVITPVVPTISGPGSVCTDAEVIYSAAPLTNVTFMEWVITTPALASVVGGQNTPNATIQFNNTAGTATIEFKYTVCNVVYSVFTNVNITGFPAVNLTVPTDVCQNDLTNVTASLTPPPGGTVSWTWDFGPVSQPGGGGNTSSINYNFPTSGTIPVTATATYSGGSCTGSSTASQLVNVKPAPVVNITTTNGNALCPPSFSTTLVAAVQGTGTYSYNWTGPGGPHTGTSWTVNTVGTYTLVVTDLVNNCSSTETINIINCPPPPGTCSGVNFTYTQNCNGFNFNSSFSGGYSFVSWNFGDGSGNTTNPNPSHTYNASGYYFVTLTGTNGVSNCTYTEQVTVLFIPDFEAEYSCPGNNISVDLIDQTDYLDFAVNPLLFSYQWTWPGGSHSGLTPPPITTLPAGLNSVTLDVTYLGNTCSITKNIDVPDPISASFLTGAACEGNPIVFTNNSTPSLSNISSATWNFDVGGDNAGSNLIDGERTYDFSVSGASPVVQLTVTDIYGCVSTTTANATVYENILTGNVTVNPAGPACPSPPVTLTANIPGATVSPSYVWESNDGTISLGTAATSSPVPSTNEYVVEVTDAFGCKERSPAETVIIIPEPFAFIIGQDEYCVGEVMQLSANQGAGYTYSWQYWTPSGGGPFPYSGPSITNFATGGIPGNFTFVVTLTDNATGCSHTSAPFIVTIHDVPQGLTINNSGPNCVPANLTASVSSPASVSYVWSTGDTGPSTVALGGGTIEVTAYTPEGCQATEDIDIGEGPDLSDVAVGCYCFPEPVVWTAPDGFGYSYQWFQVTGGGNVPVGSGQNYTINSSGVYYVVVTGPAPNSCSSTSDPIIVDIGENCSECKFVAELIDLECIGRDELTGGTIYSFTADFTNFGISLAGLTGTSPQALIGGLSPTTLPGGGVTTTVTGTITLLPGNTFAVITWAAAGANGITCDFEMAIDQFPPCDGDPCDVRWYEPTITCSHEAGGYTYYDFTVYADNFGNDLINLTFSPCSSPDVTITWGGTILYGSASTIITGTIKVLNGITSDCFKVCAYDPVSKTECCWDLNWEFPPCKGNECEVEWYEPQIECFNVTGGYTYYTFSIAATNLGNTLTNLVWYPCSSPDVTITGNVNVLNGPASTLIQGMIRVRNGIGGDCFRVCAWDPVNERECCWDIDMVFPECGEQQEPCKDVRDKGSKLLCASPQVDPFGNRIYNFSIVVTSHVSNGTGWILPWFTEAENYITNLNVSSSGNTFTFTGTVVDVPPFNSPELCFRVITFDGQEICWTRICLRIPECDSSARGEGDHREGDVKAIQMSPELNVAPNPASDLIQVSYELEATGAIELKLIGIDGRVVRHISEMNRQANLPMDISDLQEGLYLLALFRDGQLVAQEKVAVLSGN